VSKGITPAALLALVALLAHLIHYLLYLFGHRVIIIGG
jgi:hypothetical protein